VSAHRACSAYVTCKHFVLPRTLIISYILHMIKIYIKDIGPSDPIPFNSLDRYRFRVDSGSDRIDSRLDWIESLATLMVAYYRHHGLLLTLLLTSWVIVVNVHYCWHQQCTMTATTRSINNLRCQGRSMMSIIHDLYSIIRRQNDINALEIPRKKIGKITNPIICPHR
jgi:hypothetical protein